MARVAQHRRLIGPDFVQLSGDDPTALGFNATGGVGAISVTSNVAPGLCAKFQEATLNGDWETARTLNDRLLPLHHALFSSSSPGPSKYAMSLLGVMNTELRLPLTEPDEASRKAVREALAMAGLLEPADV
jgi:4-hydroxy-tetrahydrodipicolinate synthase